MTQRSHLHTLVRDQRGAVLLVGVFFATFLVGAAYYVVGVGEAVIHRQRMQDAADAGAFAAAVLHARGMNIIALINTMMAALLSVLVLLKLMEALLTIAILALSIAAFFTAGSTSGLIAPLTRVRNVVTQLESKVKPVVNKGLNALHWASKSIRVAMPAAVEFRVVDTIVHEYGDVAYFGFALPMSLTLPVEPDKFSVVCGEAGKIVGDLATLPVKGIAPTVVLETVENAAKSMTSSLQAYFCGGTGVAPPAFEPPDKTIQLPKLASRKTCEDNRDHARAEELCRQAAIDEAQGEPREFGSKGPVEGPWVGECRQESVTYVEPRGGLEANVDPKDLPREPTTSDCKKWEQWIQTATNQCNPYADAKPYGDELSNFVWQAARKEEQWEFVDTPEGQRWVKKPYPNPNNHFTHQHIERGDLPGYCKQSWDPTSEELCHAPKKDWVVICPQAWAPDGSPLLCYPNGTIALPKVARVGSIALISYPVVRRLLGCETKLSVDAVKLGVEPGGGVTNQEKKSSFKLVDDALLGEDIFQLRVVVLGRDIGEAALNRVKVALRGPEDARVNMLNQLRHLGQISVAQAEYFTTEANGKDQDSEEVRRQWMWTPRWRARLRRIWIPTEFSHASKSHDDKDLNTLAKPGQKSTSIEQSCKGAHGSSSAAVDTSQCSAADKQGGLSKLIKGLSEIFIH
jgi:hypothetical protein